MVPSILHHFSSTQEVHNTSPHMRNALILAALCLPGPLQTCLCKPKNACSNEHIPGTSAIICKTAFPVLLQSFAKPHSRYFRDHLQKPHSRYFRKHVKIVFSSVPSHSFLQLSHHLGHSYRVVVSQRSWAKIMARINRSTGHILPCSFKSRKQFPCALCNISCYNSSSVWIFFHFARM